jgi:sugar diacid utilization regulator
MADVEPGCTLSDLLDAEGIGARLLQGGPANLDRVVTRTRLVVAGDVGDVEPDTLLVHLVQAAVSARTYVAELEKLRELPGSALIATWPPAGVTDDEVRRAAGPHLVLRVDVDPATLISEVARATRPSDRAMTQRLTSLQRAMTQALTEPEPMKALTSRVAKTCNAVAAIVKADGELESASGPLPLALLLAELQGDFGESRTFAVEGWHGIGVRISGEDGLAGWLIVAGRRPSFPEPYAIAAAHVAASLVETNVRIDLLARRQDRAVRSSVLEQILSLRLERHDAELEGRLAALGISFADETRVINVTLLPGRPRRHGAAALEAMFIALDHELTTVGAPHLLAMRDNMIVGLVQASARTVQRRFVTINRSLQGFLLGIGRRAASTGDVVDSYNDSLLAVRTLRAPGRSATSMAYEEFDFATRLFSDVGLDRMARWAEEMLAPLADQQILVDGLRRYFEHGFNIIAAAKALKIHHNSLRYRLSRAEELLGVSLRDPAAVSSLFLALTATSMAQQRPVRRPSESAGAREPGTAIPADAVMDALEEYEGRLSDGFGVAIGPER